MQMKLGGLALLVAIAAAGLATYGFLQERDAPSDLELRLASIEDQMARIEIRLQRQASAGEREPTLFGVGVPDAEVDAEADAATRAERSRLEAIAAGRRDPLPEDRAYAAEAAEELKALVDQAVEKKAAQLQGMKNKKPSIDVFANTLELSEAQRQATEQEVLQAQHDIKAILDVPAADGTNFMEEIVEVLADGMARPGKNPGGLMKLFGRLMTETLPGSDETYAMRLEAVKTSVRETFRRSWTKEQYATFETWQMDPTEVKGIEGSPWKGVETLVFERAKELGAELPARDNR